MGRKKNELNLESEYNYDRLGVQKLGMAYQLLVPSALPSCCNKNLSVESIKGDKLDGEISGYLCPGLIGAAEGRKDY
ncbi:MAG: hypothetical protein PHV82_17375 [Victivallaceae bacterium]|nr:hypothetical protein [Victivallaceae bacterium]